MALIEIEEPTPAALRWFGVPFAGVFALVGALVWIRGEAPTAAAVIWASAAAVLAIYYAAPRLRRGVYLAWMYAGYPIGFVMSHLTMAVTYYLVLAPIGLILRANGRDPMNRREPKPDAPAKSHWQPRRKRDPSSYFRQF
jgi:hypothetical protein